MRVLLLLSGILCLFGLADVADAEDGRRPQRVVLIVANEGYDGVRWNLLANPVNDARLLKSAFEKIGFDVLPPAVNLNRAALETRLRDFQARSDALAPGSIAVIYYTGHGVQVEGTNYLVPIGAPAVSDGDALAPLAREAWLAKHFVSLNETLKAFGQNRDEVRHAANLLILDACRVNPWEQRSKGPRRTKGLADIPSAANTLIAFSAAPGTTADDGSDQNSIYAQVLSQQLMRTNLPVELVFSNVTIEVGTRSRAVDRFQRPDYRFALSSSFCLDVCAANLSLRVANVPVSTNEPSAGVDCGLCLSSTSMILDGKELFVADAPTDLRLWRRCVKELGCKSVGDPKGDERLAVTGVRWSDAAGFASWASLRFGRSYRLMTSKEWNDLVKSLPDTPRTATKGGLRPMLPSAREGVRADLFGQLLEWTSSCDSTDCERHIARGATFDAPKDSLMGSFAFPSDATGEALGFRLVEERH